MNEIAGEQTFSHSMLMRLVTNSRKCAPYQSSSSILVMRAVPIIVIHLGQKNAVRQFAADVELFTKRRARFGADQPSAHCINRGLIGRIAIAIVNDDQLPVGAILLGKAMQRDR